METTKPNIRSACENTNCNTCGYVNEKDCFNTEKRNRSPIYLMRS
jgi:hypothetical protein